MNNIYSGMLVLRQLVVAVVVLLMKVVHQISLEQAIS